MSLRIVLISTVLFVVGCSGSYSTEPNGATRQDVQRLAAKPRAVRFVPPPDRIVQSTLLNFESPDDVSFVESRSVRIAADPAKSTNHALATTAARIKLGALVRGREFPGPWDVIGFRVRAVTETRGSVAIGRGAAPAKSPTTFSLTSGDWRYCWFDLASLGLTSSSVTRPTTSGEDFTLSITSDSVILVDDIAIAQSGSTVSDSLVPKTGERFLVRRVGLEWQASFGSDVVLRLPALPFVADGFRVAEAGPTRTLLATVDESRTICIDRTGRFIVDGQAKIDPAVLKHAKGVAESASPAQIEVIGDGGAGRVERTLPGDRDNDGFDEYRGCYSVRAEGDRVTFRLTKQRSTVRWPIVEVYDLPAGAVNVWIEGQIVPSPVRLSDGRVILELPIELERPVEVQVRVR